MTMLYPNILNNKVCHKGITLHCDHIEEFLLWYKGKILLRNYRKRAIYGNFLLFLCKIYG